MAFLDMNSEYEDSMRRLEDEENRAERTRTILQDNEDGTDAFGALPGTPDYTSSTEMSAFESYDDSFAGDDFPDPFVGGYEPTATTTVESKEETERVTVHPPVAEREPDSGLPASAALPSTEYFDGKFNEMALQINDLFERVEAFQDVERMRDVIARQGEQLSSVKDDLILKMKMPMFNVIIEFIETIDEMLRQQDADEDNNVDPRTRYDNLKGDVERLQRYMIAELANQQVEQFSDVNEDPLKVSKRQEIVERIDTTNENIFLEHGGEDVTTCYKSMSPGYVYRQLDTTDKTTGMPVEHVIRYEKVVRYVLKKTI